MKTYVIPSVKIHNVTSRDLVTTSGSTDGTIDDMEWGAKERHSGSGWNEYEN